MDFYEYWSNYYATQTSSDDDKDSLRGVIDGLIQKGYMSYDVIVDSAYNKQMLIYEHVDPIEGKNDDMRAICLDKENLHWGNIIKLSDGRHYMSVTRGDWNGVYLKYKIRELLDDVSFTTDSPVSMKTILANKGFYDESSYTNETNVFEDKELRACLLQYNENTKQLTLFDDLYINNEHYKIVKIDNHTYREYDEEFGVLQVVIIDTPFGEIKANDKIIKGIVMSARVKDKILNSVSKEILCEYDAVKRGDYVDFTYDRDEKGKIVTDTYLTVNNPTMGEGYDRSLLYLCESKVNLLDDKGNVVDVPLYFENNRSRIDKITDNEYITLRGSSFLVMCQQNEVTKRLKNKVKRIMIDGDVYEVTGLETLSTGIMSIGMELGKIDPNDDNIELGIANYYSQMREIEDMNPPTSNGIQGSSKMHVGEYEDYTIDMPCLWSMESNIAKLEALSDTKCRITCVDNTDFVGRLIKLQATVGETIYEKEIKVVSW